jgi:hypothetical protein
MWRQNMAESADANRTRQFSMILENPSESVESAILSAVRSIRYGSVEITIHDSQVVQIECKKKLRMQINRNK